MDEVVEYIEKNWGAERVKILESEYGSFFRFVPKECGWVVGCNHMVSLALKPLPALAGDLKAGVNDGCCRKAEKSWETLEGACYSCRKCKLWERRTNVVIGKGSRTADILFIGEGPGQQEDLQGVPFVGPAGQLLDKMLESVVRDQCQRRAVRRTHIIPLKQPDNDLFSVRCTPVIRVHPPCFLSEKAGQRTLLRETALNKAHMPVPSPLSPLPSAPYPLFPFSQLSFQPYSIPLSFPWETRQKQYFPLPPERFRFLFEAAAKKEPAGTEGETERDNMD